MSNRFKKLSMIYQLETCELPLLLLHTGFLLFKELIKLSCSKKDKLQRKELMMILLKKKEFIINL